MKKKWTAERTLFWFMLSFALLVILYLLFLVITADRASIRKDKAFLLFEMIIGVGTIFVPVIISKLAKIKIPSMIKIYYWLFILFSVFIGTGLQVIAKIYYWDKILHVSSSMLIVAVGYGLMGWFLPKEVYKRLSPTFFVLFGFAFGLAGGVVWEFYEFTCDGLLGMNLQRYAQAGQDLIGRAALMDTMGDLLVDALGSLIFSLFCLVQSKGDASFFQKFSFKDK